ncbi:MAG: ATP-binding protein [Ignavibacteriaceae bacterium]|nr:ATP-binding protein [Ignavibacteriaceae bacterium]
MNNLKLTDFGPIKEADIEFGDLTLFIGAQASGKSVVLQLAKLLQDKKQIRNTLNQYAFTWGDTKEEIFERYFGEGMSALIKESTNVTFNGKKYDLNKLKPQRGELKNTTAQESIFYIPAHRVLCVQKGWPNYFSDYDSSDPYVLRNFSETLRLSITQEMLDKQYFPQNNKMKKVLRDAINREIFHDSIIEIKKTDRHRFVLNVNKDSLGFGQWSTGQKEFLPLLMSFYWLFPAAKVAKRNKIEIVVIEEPEMGLHPNAIKTVILNVLELLFRGYKVIISTHSNVLLDFVWAFNLIKAHKGNINDILELFGIKNVNFAEDLKDVLEKKIKTYYFKHTSQGVEVKDISSLDANSEDDDISDWGGISSFTSTAAEIVSRLVSINE